MLSTHPLVLPLLELENPGVRVTPTNARDSVNEAHGLQSVSCYNSKSEDEYTDTTVMETSSLLVSLHV